MRGWFDWTRWLAPILKEKDQQQSFTQKLDFFRTFVKPGDLAVDIGAHGGQRIEILSALKARVIALEPNPRFYRELVRQFRRHSNVTILQMGAGSRCGKSTFFMHQDAAKAGTFSRDLMDSWREMVPQAQTGWQEVPNVELITLDALCERYGTPDFCSIDVQGYESEVLRGLSRELRCLVFGVAPHHRQDALQCVQLLLKLGDYRFNYSFNEVNGLGQRHWIPQEDMLRKFREFVNLDMPNYQVFALRSNSFAKPRVSRSRKRKR